MNDEIKEAVETIVSEVLDKMPDRVIEPPFLCLSLDKTSGFALGVSLKDGEPKWYDPIGLMKKAVIENGWTDESMQKGIKGVRSLLRHLEREYKKHKNPQSPDA